LLVVCGTMTLIIVVFTGFASPTFRKLDLQKDIDENDQ